MVTVVTQHSFYLYSFHLFFGRNWQSAYLLFLTKFTTQHTARICVKLRRNHLSHERAMISLSILLPYLFLPCFFLQAIVQPLFHLTLLVQLVSAFLLQASSPTWYLLPGPTRANSYPGFSCLSRRSTVRSKGTGIQENDSASRKTQARWQPGLRATPTPLPLPRDSSLLPGHRQTETLTCSSLAADMHLPNCRGGKNKAGGGGRRPDQNRDHAPTQPLPSPHLILGTSALTQDGRTALAAHVTPAAPPTRDWGGGFPGNRSGVFRLPSRLRRATSGRKSERRGKAKRSPVLPWRAGGWWGRAVAAPRVRRPLPPRTLSPGGSPSLRPPAHPGTITPSAPNETPCPAPHLLVPRHNTPLPNHRERRGSCTSSGLLPWHSVSGDTAAAGNPKTSEGLMWLLPPVPQGAHNIHLQSP